MSFFSCKFYKTYLYFIIYWALDIINNIEWEGFQSKYNFDYFYSNFYYYKLKINTKYYFPFAVESELLNLVILILADLLFGFLVAYTYIRMKCLKKRKKEIIKSTTISKNNYELIYNKPSILNSSTLTLILVICILDFIARSIELFFFLLICPEKAEEKHIRWLITMEILPRIIFCRFILKIKLYRHQYLSIFFFFIGFLIISIIGIRSIETKNQKMYVFAMVFPKIIYGLEDTINKILLTDKLLLPHFLLFYRGFINTIILLFIILSLCLTSHIDYSYYKNILENIQTDEIIFKIISIIAMIFKIFCIFKIIYIFTPQHVGFCVVIIYIYNAIKSMVIIEDFTNEFLIFLVNIICLIFIGIGTIIFNEMVIINICGLNENTKSNIIKKAKFESIELQEASTFNEDIEDNDNDNDNEENLNQSIQKKDETSIN